jgi:hypothetical protein
VEAGGRNLVGHSDLVLDLRHRHHGRDMLGAEVGMLSLPTSVEEWTGRALAWLAVSAIATPIIGICVWLAPPRRTAMVVLLGGAIPAIAIYGFFILILAPYGR